MESVNLAEYVVAATVLIGFVNIIKLAVDRNWRGFSLAITAVVAGTLFGYLQWFMLPSIEMGFALGVASSGTYEVAQRLGGH